MGVVIVNRRKRFVKTLVQATRNGTGGPSPNAFPWSRLTAAATAAFACVCAFWSTVIYSLPERKAAAPFVVLSMPTIKITNLELSRSNRGEADVQQALDGTIGSLVGVFETGNTLKHEVADFRTLILCLNTLLEVGRKVIFL